MHRSMSWDGTYEILAAEILAGIVKTFDPTRERSWIAERNGAVIGSSVCGARIGDSGETPAVGR